MDSMILGGAAGSGFEAPGGTQAIVRAARILHQLATCAHEGTSTQALAEALGLQRSTAHRILRCLLSEGLVAQDPQSRKYILGQKMYEYGLAASSRFMLRDYCEAGMAQVASATGDTTFLTIRSGFEAVVIDRHEGPFPIKAMPVAIGDRRPLGMGAGSLAILMALPDDQVEQVLTVNATRLRKERGIDTKGMMRKIHHSRSRGFALVRGTRGELPISAVGMPIRNRWGLPCAAVSVTSMAARMHNDHLRLVIESMRKGIQVMENSLRKS